MRIEQPSFNTHAGTDHTISNGIDSSTLNTKIIKSIYRDVMQGNSGCQNGYANHCRLVFSNVLV